MRIRPDAQCDEHADHAQAVHPEVLAAHHTKREGEKNKVEVEYRADERHGDPCERVHDKPRTRPAWGSQLHELDHAADLRGGKRFPSDKESRTGIARCCTCSDHHATLLLWTLPSVR